MLLSIALPTQVISASISYNYVKLSSLKKSGLTEMMILGHVFVLGNENTT